MERDLGARLYGDAAMPPESVATPAPIAAKATSAARAIAAAKASAAAAGPAGVSTTMEVASSVDTASAASATVETVHTAAKLGAGAAGELAYEAAAYHQAAFRPASADDFIGRDEAVRSHAVHDAPTLEDRVATGVYMAPAEAATQLE